SANVLMGRGISVSGIPLAMNFSPRDTVYKFPLNFGDKDTTYFKGTATIPAVGGLSQQGRRVTKVDGWGLIKTPYGQFNCIRIRTDITETDSLIIATLKIPIPNNRTIYTWYAKNEHYPILEITQTTGIAGTLTIRYKDINRPEAFYNAAKFNASRTTATTLDTVNLTSTSTGSPKSYQWTITPNTVSFVGGTSATTNNPRVIFNTTGVYTIKLKVIYEGGQDDTIRTNYVTINPAPVVNFSANKTNASVGENVTFTDNSTGTPTTYKWAFTPNTVTFVTGTSSSKNPIVKFNEKGSYSVSFTANYFTTPIKVTKSNYINIQNVGVNNSTNFTKSISIYPNPAKNNLFIESNYDLSKSVIAIYDVLGKKMNLDIDNNSSKSSVQLNISNYNNGIYFVKIMDEFNSNATFKIIVE
ncbi:MAG: T9SS type A sorting domain-containing protein, partial [Bacteroidia bacterium]